MFLVEEVSKNKMGIRRKIQLEETTSDKVISETTNNIYSLYMAKDVLAQDDTILLESDLIYDKKIIRELIDNPEKNLCVVSPFENWMDGTVTVLDESV